MHLFSNDKVIFLKSFESFCRIYELNFIIIIFICVIFEPRIAILEENLVGNKKKHFEIKHSYKDYQNRKNLLIVAINSYVLDSVIILKYFFFIRRFFMYEKPYVFYNEDIMPPKFKKN